MPSSTWAPRPARTSTHPSTASSSGMSDYVISGKRLGSRVDIQPSSEPSLVVSLTHLRIDPALAVGAAVTASSSKLGTVMDFSRFERQTLARYTRDAGNHVSLESTAADALRPITRARLTMGAEPPGRAGRRQASSSAASLRLLGS